MYRVSRGDLSNVKAFFLFNIFKLFEKKMFQRARDDGATAMTLCESSEEKASPTKLTGELPIYIYVY